MNKKNQLGLDDTTAEQLRAEREHLTQQVERLEKALSLTTARLQRAEKQNRTHHSASSASRGLSNPLNRTLITAAGFLLLSTAASLTGFQDAGSTINRPVDTLTATADAASDATVSSNQSTTTAGREDAKKSKTSAPKSTRSRTRLATAGSVQHRQWGPALHMETTPAQQRHYPFNPLVQQQQQDLLVLGFDIGKADGFGGPKTQAALQEFKALYLSGNESSWEPKPAELATIINSYATLARNDAAAFNIDRGVVAAIRLSSVRTAVEFPYLMELAAAESNFNPASQAKSSSASGLYQFTRDTWLNTVRKHGAKYGLERYTSQIEFYIDRNGNQRPMVKDQSVLEHLLELRKNPRISAMMAAETVKDNRQLLSFSLDREPERTDLYLMHFLGNAGAISFLRELDRNPGVPAVELFPRAAKSNKNIFHPRTCGPRTLSDVYQLFDEKFNTSRYEDS
jgi:hypothetical protein